MVKSKKTLPVKKDKAPKAAKRIVKVKDESVALMKSVVKGMQEKKAKEIVSIDLREIKNAIADFFIVCHADSRTHIDAIARSVEEMVFNKSGEEPIHREGFTNSEWILLDYTNVVVHIFLQEKREFYGIERLWADANIQRVAGNY
jgi:ribosome-associated protein